MVSKRTTKMTPKLNKPTKKQVNRFWSLVIRAMDTANKEAFEERMKNPDLYEPFDYEDYKPS